MTSPKDKTIAHPRDDARSVDELISVALGEPAEDPAWDAIFALRWRATREVFGRASGLCRIFCPVERKLGAAILGQLGIPDRSHPKSCLSILLGMLEAGAQSMQRQIGVPSALVVVVEGVTMLLVLAAMVRRS